MENKQQNVESFKVKDYTTHISASRTQSEIEEMLVKAGAEAIMKTYRGDGRTDALTFKYQGRGYKLPSNTEKCIEVLKGIKEYRNKDRFWLSEQAERVAWRVIRDWLDAQLSLIQIGQAEVEQVMLPYMWNGRQSLYDVMKEQRFALPNSKSE